MDRNVHFILKTGPLKIELVIRALDIKKTRHDWCGMSSSDIGQRGDVL